MKNVEFLWIWHAARRAQKKLNGMAAFLLLFEGKTVWPSKVWPKDPCAFSLLNGKDGEFGYFERMKRKKISRVKSMAEMIAAEIMVGRLSKIEVFAVDDWGSDRWKTTRPKIGNGGMRDGSFSTRNAERASTKSRAGGRTWPPQWRSPTGSVLSRQDCRPL